MASVANSRYAASAASANAGPQSYQQAQQFQQQQQQAAGMQTQALSAQSQMQQAQQQAQSNMIDQRSNNALVEQQQADQWMQSQQWTTQDESQLAQVQNGWSQIQADPSLTNEEKQAAQQQYQPYLQQQQQRKEYWQAKMQKQQQQLQAEQAAHLHAQTTSMNMQAKKAEAGQMGDMIYEKDHYDPDGNWIGKTVKSPDGKGGWDTKHFEGDTKKPDHAAADAAKAYETEVKHRREDYDSWTKEYHDALKQATEWSKETNPAASSDQKPTLKYPNAATNERWVEDRAKEIMATKKLEMDPEAYQSRMAAMRAAMRGEKPKTEAPEKGVGQNDTPPANTGANQTEGAATKEEKPKVEPAEPFKFDQEKKTPQQQRVVDQFAKMRDQLSRSGAMIKNTQEYGQAVTAYKQMEDLAQKYGNLPKMRKESPDDYKLWNDAQSLFNAITGFVPPAPSAPQSAAPQAPQKWRGGAKGQ